MGIHFLHEAASMTKAARFLRRGLAASLATVSLLSAGGAAATPVTINVALDTAPLIAGVTGPYSLEFQLIDGDGVANSMVSVSNLHFGGGAAVGSPDFTGGASGAARSGFTLADTDFSNALILGFSAGTTLTFDLSFDPLGPVSGAPDRLTFAILDASLFEVPTIGAGNELLGIDLIAPTVIETYDGIDDGTSPRLSAPTVTVNGVPEPNSQALAILAMLTMLLARRRESRRGSV